jgi:toxin ParE1/3/4
MPQTYRIIYTRRAADELTAIFTYIEHDSPRNAARLIERLLSSIESVDLFPHRHKVVKNADELGEEVRSMPVRPYLIRYHIDDKNSAVTILSVRHGARQPDL